MNIIVCIKRVPDTGARIEIEMDGPDIGIDIKADLPWILNPYDEFAIEEALRIREAFGGRVTLLNAGVEGGEEVLKRGIAMGADNAVYIKDHRLKGPKGLNDGLRIARVLSKAILTIPFDLILCGKQGADGDSGIVGGAVAGLLNIPLVTAVKRLKVYPEKSMIEASREVEGGIEIVECPLPALLTVHKGLNEPRYPSLSGIMKAKKAQIMYLAFNSLGIIPEDLFKEMLKREGLAYRQSKRKGAILSGDIKEQVKEAVRFLCKEVKVI